MKLGIILLLLQTNGQDHRLRNIDCGYSLEPPRTHNLCFVQKYEKYQNFLSENFDFLVVFVRRGAENVLIVPRMSLSTICVLVWVRSYSRIQ